MGTDCCCWNIRVSGSIRHDRKCNKGNNWYRASPHYGETTSDPKAHQDRYSSHKWISKFIVDVAKVADCAKCVHLSGGGMSGRRAIVFFAIGRKPHRWYCGSGSCNREKWILNTSEYSDVELLRDAEIGINQIQMAGTNAINLKFEIRRSFSFSHY